MRYGATNSPLIPLAEEIKTISALGFDYLELCLDPPEAESGNLLKIHPEMIRLAGDLGLDIAVAHLPTFVWLADVYPSIREASIMETVRALDVAARFDIGKAVLHPGYVTGMLRFLPNQGLENALESLHRLTEEALGRNITLCLENMFPRAGHMYRPEEFAQVLESEPSLNLTLDLGHAHIKAPPGRALVFIKTLGSRIGHVHVSDNSGSEDDHLPLGAGTVDVAGGISALKRLGYDDTITLEVFSPDRDWLQASLIKIKKFWKEG